MTVEFAALTYIHVMLRCLSVGIKLSQGEHNLNLIENEMAYKKFVYIHVYKMSS